MSGKTNTNAVPTRKSRSTRSQQRAQAWKSRRPEYVTYSSYNGGRITLGPNPPSVVYQPWNKLTLVHIMKTKEEFSVKDFKTILRQQIDPTKRGMNHTDSGDGRFVVQIKFHKIRVWNITGNVLALSVDDFLDSKASKGGREQLCGIVDTGTTAHIPSAGYTLPISHRQHVIRTDDQEDDTILFTVQLDNNATGIIYLDIEYRFDGPVTPPSITNHLSTIAQRTGRIENIILDQRKETSVIGQVIDSLASTLGKMVIEHGSDKIALLVSSLLEEKMSAITHDDQDGDSVASSFSKV